MSDIVTLNGYKIKDEKAVRSYETVALMKADTKLKEGYHVKTKGYYETNDGGHGEYVIVDDDTLVDDGGSIHTLNNGLRAQLIVNDKINVKQFGSYGDGIHDDTLSLQNALNNFDNVYLPNGTYIISTSLKLKENNTIQGESKSKSIITTNSTINLIEPKDESIKNILISNLSLYGNYNATSGICLYKTSNPDLSHVDTHIRIKNVYVNRCTNWCVMIGRDNTERALPNTVIDDLTIEQFTGGGLYLSNRCTDSTIQNVFVGGGSLGTKPNIQVEGYNLHFNNCKSYYSGNSESHQDAWYFNGAGVISGEIEAQDSYKYGVELYQSKYINLNIITDKCGEINSNYPSIYINDGGFMNLNISCSNAESNNIFNSKSCVKLNKASHINMNIVKQNNVDYIFDNNDTFANTKFINFNLNGSDVIDVTPSFETQNYNDNGIVAKSIGENKILITGTATAEVSLALKGGYGENNVLSRITANKVVNILNNEKTYFQVFYDRTSVLASAREQFIKPVNSDMDITGLVLKIPNGTTINEVVEPKILIIPNS